jgi:hypothetical protein
VAAEVAVRSRAPIIIAMFAAGCGAESVPPVGPPGPRPLELGASAHDSARGRLVVYGGQTIVDGSPLPLASTWEFDGEKWIEVSTAGPGPLSEHAMAYDAARGVVVLYGGIGGAFSCEKTWEYDGATWTPRELSGAGCRYRHTMTYDAANRRIILFGGVAPDGCDAGDCQQTWSFEGTRWALITLPPG